MRYVAAALLAAAVIALTLAGGQAFKAVRDVLGMHLSGGQSACAAGVRCKSPKIPETKP